VNSTATKLEKRSPVFTPWLWVRAFMRAKVPLGPLTGFLALALVFAFFLRSHKQTPISQADLSKEGLGVEDLISRVKSELTELEKQERARGEDALFAVKDFDLEINFIVHTHITDKGEVTTHLVTVGQETETALDKVQKITLHLETLPPPHIKAKYVPDLKSDDPNIAGPVPPAKSVPKRTISR
jgi:NTP-dependent ternary system trypsin peptidase co-occuring protein